MAGKHLFDKSLYRFEEPQPSWWEASSKVKHVESQPLKDSQSCDIAIIGGGYTGLSAALHLARDYSADVRVLEAGHIGWGASGRNGGFVTVGGTQLGISSMIRQYGEDETKHYYRCQMEAVDLVRSIAADENIDIQLQGESEIIVAEKPSHFTALSEQCRLENSLLGLNTKMISRETFREECYDAPHQYGALSQKPGFGLHPLQYVLGLGKAAKRHGAILHPHSEVLVWRKENDRHILETGHGSLTAKNVIVACNGFMPDHLTKDLAGRALPLQSQIIVTRPLSDNELAAHNWRLEDPAINSRNVYGYYRMLPEKRFMMGGRADFVGTSQGAEETALRLSDFVAEMWPEWKDIEVEYTWRGLVCFTTKLRPSIGRLPQDPSVYFGFGYHGNGVNNATWTGREIARWMMGSNARDDLTPNHLPAVVRGMTPKFPFAGLRRFYAKTGVAWHRFLDRMDGFK